MTALRLRPLAPSDLDLLEGPRRSTNAPPASMRDAHHVMARMFALGLRVKAVAERMGYSAARVSTIRQSPAFDALIAHYRGVVDAEFKATSHDMFALLAQNTHRAERFVAERLDEHETAVVAAELGEETTARMVPLKELLAISRDGADRVGYGKRSVNLNLNADFAGNLEAAIRRSRQAQMIDVTPDESLPAPGPQIKRRA